MCAQEWLLQAQEKREVLKLLDWLPVEGLAISAVACMLLLLHDCFPVHIVEECVAPFLCIHAA
jgi:hypothetical protein